MKSMLLFSALLFLASCGIKNGFYAVPEATKAPPVLTCEHQDALKDHQYRNACVFKVCNVESDANYSKVLAYKKFIDDLTDPTMKKNSYLIHDPSLCTIPEDKSAKMVKFLVPPSATSLKGVELTIQPSVAILMSSGSIVTDADREVSFSVYQDSACATQKVADSSWKMSSQNPATTQSGVSQVSGLTFLEGGTFYLKAESAGLATDCSSAMNVSLPILAKKVVFKEPYPSSSANKNSLLSVQPKAVLIGSNDEVLKVAGTSISLSLYKSSDCSGAESDGLSVDAKSLVTNELGEVSFSGVKVSAAGSYSLKVSSANLADDCKVITISDAADTISFYPNPPSFWVKNKVFEPISVKLQNSATSSQASEEIPITLNVYQDDSCSTIISDSDVEGVREVNSDKSSGVAVFSNIKIKKSGKFSFKASGYGLETICASVELADQLTLLPYKKNSDNVYVLKNPLVTPPVGFFKPSEIQDLKFKVQINRALDGSSKVAVNMPHQVINFRAYKSSGVAITTCSDLPSSVTGINIGSQTTGSDGSVTFDQVNISEAGTYCLCAEDGFSTNDPNAKLTKSCHPPINIADACTDIVSGIKVTNPVAPNTVIYNYKNNVSNSSNIPLALNNTTIQLSFNANKPPKSCPVSIALYFDDKCTPENLAKSVWSIKDSDSINFVTDTTGKLIVNDIHVNAGILYMKTSTIGGSNSSRKWSPCYGPIISPNTLDVDALNPATNLSANINQVLPSLSVKVMGRNHQGGQEHDTQRLWLEGFNDPNLKVTLKAYRDSFCDLNTNGTPDPSDDQLINPVNTAIFPVIAGQTPENGVVVFDNISFAKSGTYYLKAVADDAHAPFLERGYTSYTNNVRDGYTIPVSSVCYGPYVITNP